ncbi:uncharacterized protein [Euphorbia lathyris]|uniref:uncharacterized protein n=1 Tax=Euphorbia lathyris TaxID=212925 RepID=UPI0033142B88
MLSPCLIEAKEACFNGCFPGFPQSETAKSITTAASSRYEFENAMISSISPNSRFTNHESIPSLHESLTNFIASFPQFPLTDHADKIRQQHYYHLSSSDHVCLDYIGHGLFSYSQLSSSISIPSTSTTPPSNPNSNSDSNSLFFNVSYKSVSLNSQLQYGAPESDLETNIRRRIMSFMNVSEDEYTMVFTANQGSAFKIVAEAYPFQSHSNVLTVYDYENESVKSMIENCKKKRARIMSAEFVWPGMRIQGRKLQKKLESKRKSKSRRGLFVFPLQSRVTGARYSYSWMRIAEENGWHVLLDATSLGAKDMETLGLSILKPDFLICSFFKIFGENPSGFACLFVKRSSLSVLKDSSMATNTGIVKLVPAVKPSEVSEELSISEIEESEIGDSEMEFKGLDDADKLGLILISTRSRYLINWLINALMSLEHPYSENGHPPIKIYGPKIKFERGPAVAFNVFDWKGEKIDPELVQKLADRNNISLSYGFLRNIWVPDEEEEEREKMLMEGRSGLCVVTVALGFLTSFEDVYRLWSFVSCFLDADFVEKERWRYTALNQNIIEV